MAMKELKSFSVAPGTEEQEIQLWRSFGWELVGTPQEVRTADSQVFTGQDSDGTEHYRTTAGVHYIKLTFERDPKRKNYNELKSLEEQYYAIQDPYFPPAPQLITLIWVILILLGLLFFIVPGVILLVVHIVSFVKKNKKWNNEEYPEYKSKKAAADAQREEILAKAQALV